MIHILKIKLGCTIVVTLASTVLFAQSVTEGNTYVAASGEMTVVDAHSFVNGGTGTFPGIVGTERDVLTAHFSFATGSSWIGAADNAHIDGYVRTYLTGAFIFPIGDNGNYSPAAVSASSFANPTDAAYFAADPNTAITSNLKGGNHAALPTGAPFSTASFDGTTLTAISTKEYWDINGTTAAKISLTWDSYSDINTLTAGTLSKLTIVGWDGTQWVKIPTTVDATSILGGSSNLTAGSITSDAAIVPNTYTAYTFGNRFDKIKLYVYAYLEGAYTGTSPKMTTKLSASGATSVLATSALTQPYSAAPWSYTGTESVAATFFDTHSNVVDWVLIQLRDKNDKGVVLYQKACFLTNDGAILDIDGNVGVDVFAPADDYYMTFVHRNHANVGSLTTLPVAAGIATWDIRTSNTNVFTTGGNPRGVKAVGSDFVLHGGDCDNNQSINAADNNLISLDFFKSGYYLGDTYLDGVVNATDNNLISLNFFFTISFY